MANRTRKGGRLHLRVDKELEEQVHAYAIRHKTTLTELVTRFFRELLAAEAETKSDAEQI